MDVAFGTAAMRVQVKDAESERAENKRRAWRRMYSCLRGRALRELMKCLCSHTGPPQLRSYLCLSLSHVDLREPKECPA